MPPIDGTEVLVGSLSRDNCKEVHPWILKIISRMRVAVKGVAVAGRQPCYPRRRGSGVPERKSLKPIPKASEDPHMFLFIDSYCLSKKAMKRNQNMPLKL